MEEEQTWARQSYVRDRERGRRRGKEEEPAVGLGEIEENPSAYCLMMLQENGKRGRKEWLWR